MRNSQQNQPRRAGVQQGPYNPQPHYQAPWPNQPQPDYPPQYYPPAPPTRRRRPMGCLSCLLVVIAPLALAFLLLTAYFLAPLRTDFLILGIDRAPEGTALGRSDTMILVS